MAQQMRTIVKKVARQATHLVELPTWSKCVFAWTPMRVVACHALQCATCRVQLITVSNSGLRQMVNTPGDLQWSIIKQRVEEHLKYLEEASQPEV